MFTHFAFALRLCLDSNAETRHFFAIAAAHSGQ
jgi:hypothetical protein